MYYVIQYTLFQELKKKMVYRGRNVDPDVIQGFRSQFNK